jgi:hypothetical protein
MPVQKYAPRPAHLRWLLDSDPAIRWQVMRDLTGEAPDAIAAERSRVATEGWGAQLLARQSPAGHWGGPKADRGLLVTFNSLVVLKDLGLDPASREARKMIERVDKHLVFTWHNNRPFLQGETEPCINGRILGIGSYFKEPNDALAKQLLERAARRWRLELRSYARLSEEAQKPAFFVPYHHLRARRVARLRTSRGQTGGRHQGPQGGRKLSVRAPHVPLASNRRSHRPALAPLFVSDVLAL